MPKYERYLNRIAKADGISAVYWVEEGELQSLLDVVHPSTARVCSMIPNFRTWSAEIAKMLFGMDATIQQNDELRVSLKASGMWHTELLGQRVIVLGQLPDQRNGVRVVVFQERGHAVAKSLNRMVRRALKAAEEGRPPNSGRPLSWA